MAVRPLVRVALPCAFLIAVFVAACASVGPTDTGPVESPVSSIGATPSLPEPEKQLIPVVQVAEAKGWPAGMKPVAASGTAVNAFATGLDHPRWLYVLPDGDVLVAETNAPERPDEGHGLRGKIQKAAMEKAGSVTETANRISVLRDADGDGVAEVREVFASNLNSPFGM